MVSCSDISPNLPWQHQQWVSRTSNNIQWYYYYYYYYIHFTTLCPGLPGLVGTRRINCSGFCWSRDDGVAVASALLQKIITPAPHHSRFLQAGCSTWHPTNSVKALKAKHSAVTYKVTSSMLHTWRNNKTSHTLVKWTRVRSCLLNPH